MKESSANRVTRRYLRKQGFAGAFHRVGWTHSRRRGLHFYDIVANYGILSEVDLALAVSRNLTRFRLFIPPLLEDVGVESALESLAEICRPLTVERGEYGVALCHESMGDPTQMLQEIECILAEEEVYQTLLFLMGQSAPQPGEKGE